MANRRATGSWRLVPGVNPTLGFSDFEFLEDTINISYGILDSLHISLLML